MNYSSKFLFNSSQLIWVRMSPLVVLPLRGFTLILRFSSWGIRSNVSACTFTSQNIGPKRGTYYQVIFVLTSFPSWVVLRCVLFFVCFIVTSSFTLTPLVDGFGGVGTYCRWLRNISIFFFSCGSLTRTPCVPLFFFSLLLFVPSHGIISEVHALHMPPFCFLFLWGW